MALVARELPVQSRAALLRGCTGLLRRVEGSEEVGLVTESGAGLIPAVFLDADALGEPGVDLSLPPSAIGGALAGVCDSEVSSGVVEPVVVDVVPSSRFPSGPR